MATALITLIIALVFFLARSTLSAASWPGAEVGRDVPPPDHPRRLNALTGD